MQAIETITLWRTANGWLSRSDRPEVVRLFGTDTLPTAFPARADAKLVAARIRTLNPGARVEFARGIPHPDTGVIDH